MANVGSKGFLEHIDDPSTSVIAAAAAANVTWVAESTNGATDFSKAVAVGKGLHYTAISDTTDNDMQEICSNNLIFAGQEGFCYAEIMAQFNSVDDIAFNFGFNDTVEEVADGGTLPAELSGTTWTTTSTTFVGFVFDVDADNDDLHCMWVDDGTDSTEAIANLRCNGIHPTANKWLYMRVELQDRGSGNGLRATFTVTDHTGKSVTKEFNTTVDRDCALCYHFSFENRANAAATTCYVRGLNWGQTIPDM